MVCVIYTKQKEVWMALRKTLIRFYDGVEMMWSHLVIFMKSMTWSNKLAFLASEATTWIAMHLGPNNLEHSDIRISFSFF